MNNLSEHQRAAVEEVIAETRATRIPHAFETGDGSIVYARPAKKGIAWGVDKAGKRVARGVEK